MKASTEKTATTTSTTATQTSQEPFFGKKGGEGFFESAPQGNAPFIQAKLTINQPGDIYEQEADRVADHVVQRLAMPSPEPASPLLSTAGKSPAPIQTKCADCEQEEKLQRKEEEGPEEREEIQRKEESASPSSPGDEAGSDFSTRLQSSKGGGSPLPENTRTDMESALGTDLSGVRIHTGGEAAGMSKDINAQAFTHGSDVYFNDGKFDAGSSDGKRLLAHELVHVGQQGGGVKREVSDLTGGVNNKSIPTIDESVGALKDILLDKKGYIEIIRKREDIFRHILIHKYEIEDLKTSFEKENNITLESAITNNMKGHDMIRALSYLRYGKLRIADKIFFATKGFGYTDEETLYRILPEASEESIKIKVEEDFEKDYSDFHKEKGSLPSKPGEKNSVIAGLLESELSDWELDKAKAYYAFGKLRPVDEIRIATNRIGTELNMLFDALQNGMNNPPDSTITGKDEIINLVEKKYGCSSKPQRNFLETLYYNSYGTSMSRILDTELSGDDYLKAQIIIGVKHPIDRINKATFGPGTNVDKIFDAINMATPDEKKQLLKDYYNPNSSFYYALKGEVWKSEMDRIKSLLEIGSDENSMHSAQEYIIASGASDSEEILSEIKNSCGKKYEIYKNAWECDPKFLPDIKNNDFWVKTPSKDFDSVLSDKISEKFDYALKNDEDYIFHILDCFVTKDDQKKAISDNLNLMDLMKSKLSTSEYYKVLDKLELTDADPKTMIEQAERKIDREKSWLGGMTNAARALEDEIREWRIEFELAQSDHDITPEEQLVLKQMQRSTYESIDVYITVRNDLEDTVTNIATTAVSIGAAFMTGGLSTLANLAIVATATGMAKVATYEIIKGDRFDAIGSDALPVFTGGFVDGIFNKFTAGTAGASNSAIREMSEQMGREAAENLGESGTRKFFREVLKDGTSSALSTAAETAVDKDTWKNGLGTGMEIVFTKSAESGLSGGGTSMGIQLFKGGAKQLSIVIFKPLQPIIINNSGDKFSEFPKNSLQNPEVKYSLNGEIIDEVELLQKLRDPNLLNQGSNDVHIENPSPEVEEAINDIITSIENDITVQKPVNNSEPDIDANHPEKQIETNDSELQPPNPDLPRNEESINKEKPQPVGETKGKIAHAENQVIGPSANNDINKSIGLPANNTNLPDGYQLATSKNGKTYIRRKSGLADDPNYPQLEIDKNGNIQYAAKKKIGANLTHEELVEIDDFLKLYNSNEIENLCNFFNMTHDNFKLLLANMRRSQVYDNLDEVIDRLFMLVEHGNNADFSPLIKQLYSESEDFFKGGEWILRDITDRGKGFVESITGVESDLGSRVMDIVADGTHFEYKNWSHLGWIDGWAKQVRQDIFLAKQSLGKQHVSGPKILSDYKVDVDVLRRNRYVFNNKIGKNEDQIAQSLIKTICEQEGIQVPQNIAQTNLYIQLMQYKIIEIR